MGVRLVATAYGRPALDALSDAVDQAKAGDPLAAVTIVCPDNITGIVARRHLAGRTAAGATIGVAGIEVTTLRRLAERLAAHLLTPRRPATRPLVTAAWRRALAQAPGVFAEVADHPATVQAAVEAHAELRTLSADARAAVAATGELTRDLVRLHEDVTDLLASRYYDEVDLLDAAVTVLGQAPASTPTVLYLPQDLTGGEVRLVHALAVTADVTVVAGLTGVRRADAIVQRSLDRLGLATDHRLEPPVATRVINASDSDDEVRCVVRDLLRTLGTAPAHRVAVLYANATPYARLVHEQLGQAGVVVNGPGTRPIAERALVRALLEILDLRERDVPRAELFRALGNAPTRDPTGQRIPLARWERISRAAGVVAGEDWAGRLDAYLAEQAKAFETELAQDDPRTWKLEQLQRRTADATALRAFATDLRRQLAAAAALSSWDALANWALTLFTGLFGEDDESWLPPEEQYAKASVLTTLRALAGLDEIEPRADLDALRQALDAEFSAALPRAGRFGEGVLVAPLSAAVGLDLDTVYVLGLAEDVYPGRLHEDPLLPETARIAANGELNVTRDRLDAKHRDLLAAFSAATTVVACFPRGDLRRSTRRLPSRFLLPTLRELGGDTRLAATRWNEPAYGSAVVTAGSFAGQLLTTADLAGEQEWRIREVAATHTLDDDAFRAAHELLQARATNAFTRFDGNLGAVDGLPDLLRDDRVIAPTTLETYAKCPHAYFLERLLGVKPVEAPEDIYEISPADTGTFVHEVFDELVKSFEEALPGPGEPWSAEQRARMRELAREKAAAYERAGRTGHERLWQRARQSILADLEHMLDDDDAWRADTGARVVASEMPFGRDGQAPVSVATAEGRILMRGSADKVDLGADGMVYVTDIKTGSRSAFADIGSADPLVGGTKLQLPVYALAARDRYGSPTSPVRAAYWFVRRDRGRISVDLTPDLEQAYGSVLAVLARSIAAGVFPARAPEDADYGYVRCPYCNPDGVGYTERRREWEAKRDDPALATYVGLVEPAHEQAGDALAEAQP